MTRWFVKLGKLLNWLLPKNKNYIYAYPHLNGKTDRYDLLNCNSDNLLLVLHELCQTDIPNKAVVFLECYDPDRISVLEEWIKSKSLKKLDIQLLLSRHADGEKKSKIIRSLKTTFIRYRCKYWLSDAEHCGFHFDKTGRQKFICLSYCTPLKSGTDVEKYGTLEKVDGFVQTSLLTANICSSEFAVSLPKCPILGLPRNDTLFHREKEKEVHDWIKSVTKAKYKYMIVYAPTYRDYSGAYSSTCVFGFSDFEHKLDSFLEENKILVVTKPHPLQGVGKSVYSDRVIKYDQKYSFSLYDLLAVSDLLVSDYSSVIHDYIIADKKVVLDFFDRDIYESTRGFSFDPIDYICPGPISESLDVLLDNIMKSLTDNSVSEDQHRVCSMFHKYRDDQSLERNIDYLKKEIPPLQDRM